MILVHEGNLYSTEMQTMDTASVAKREAAQVENSLWNNIVINSTYSAPCSHELSEVFELRPLLIHMDAWTRANGVEWRDCRVAEFRGVRCHPAGTWRAITDVFQKKIQPSKYAFFLTKHSWKRIVS